MATLTVEGIPPELLARLADTAAANGRCLNSEVILSLVRYLRGQPPRPGPLTEERAWCPFGYRAPPGNRGGLAVSWGEPR